MAEKKRLEERAETKDEREKKRVDRLAQLGRETEILRAFKKVYDTPEGRFVLEWILWVTSPLGNPHDKNTSNMAFMLGEQNVGGKIIRKLIEAGCDISAAKLLKDSITNKLIILNNEISKLNKEVQK